MSANDPTIQQPTAENPTAQTPAWQGGSEEYRPGDEISGRYKLLELLGEGGMGAVWLAQQQQPVKRKVAIKLIRPGMDSKLVLARFEAERQALALMEHPNIARIFDGGVTELGRPYFVMEYIKGLPLTEYCDQSRLSVRERIDLFLPVCRAVQHAHSKGIVHRDIKPANIMICLYDGRPVPKVIDFGLAKALHQDLTEKTLHTAHGVMVGTPVYMSPEQAELNNLDVDTRTDVYSLGVVLYELLTGMTPLDREHLQRAALQEVLRLIREEEAIRPSTRLSSSQRLPAIAAQRSIDPAVLQNVLSGDLDWIVLRALEKERSRRYDSIASLARDIERYLANEAIEARPPGIGYRLTKLIRRNRLRVGVTVVLAAGLVAAGSGLIWGWREADEAQNRVTETEVQVQQQRAREQRAEKAENEQRSTAELVQADGIISGLGLTESAGLIGYLPESDYAALQAWARIEDAEQRLRILDRALSNSRTAMQIARRADDVIHACVGLSSSGRERLLQLVNQRQHGSDCSTEVRAACCLLTVAMGHTDIHGIDDVRQVLPTAGWTRLRFEASLWRLLPRLTPRDRDRGLQFLLQSPASAASITVYLSIFDPQILEPPLAASADTILEQVCSDIAAAWSTVGSSSDNLQRARNHVPLLLPIIRNLPEQSLGNATPLMVKLLRAPDRSLVATAIAETGQPAGDSLERQQRILTWQGLNMPMSYPAGGSENGFAIDSFAPEDDAVKSAEIVAAIYQAYELFVERLSESDCSRITAELCKPILEGMPLEESGLTPQALQLLFPRLPSSELSAIRRQLKELGNARSESIEEIEILAQLLAATIVQPDPESLEEIAATLSLPDAAQQQQLELLGPMLVRLLPQMDQPQVQSYWKLMLTEMRQQDAGILLGSWARDFTAGLAVRLDPPTAAEACRELAAWPTGDGFLLAGTTPALAAINARLADMTPEQLAAIRERLILEIGQAGSAESPTPLHFQIDPELTAAILKGLVAPIHDDEAAAVARQLLSLIQTESRFTELTPIVAPAIEVLLPHIEKPVLFEIWKTSLDRIRKQAEIPGFSWKSAGRDALLLKSIVGQFPDSDVSKAHQDVLMMLRSEEEPRGLMSIEERLPLLVGPALGEISSRLDSQDTVQHLQELIDVARQSVLRTTLANQGGNYASMYRGVLSALSSSLSNDKAYALAEWLTTTGRNSPPSLSALTWQELLPHLTPHQVAFFWDELYREALQETAAPLQGLNPVQSIPLCLATEYLSPEEAANRWKRVLTQLETSENQQLQPAFLLVLPSLVKRVPAEELDRNLDLFVRALQTLSASVSKLPQFSLLAFLTSDNTNEPTITLLYASLAAPGLSYHLPRPAANRFARASVDLVFGMQDSKATQYLLPLLATAADAETAAQFLARRDAFGPLRDAFLDRFEELAIHNGHRIDHPEQDAAAELADPMQYLRGLRKFASSEVRINRILKSRNPTDLFMITESMILSAELSDAPRQRQMQSTSDALEWIKKNLPELNLEEPQ